MQDQKLRKGPWFEEDQQLTTIVGLSGERRWDALAKASGLRRSGKSCRLRWVNYLRPNLKHGQISEEEEQIIVQLHQQWGNKWSRIARRLPRRTDNEVKNYWRSHLRRKLQGITERASNTSEKDEKSGSSVDSSDAFKLSNFTFLNSPYESRLSDLISCWSNDQSDKKHHVENCSGDYCFCYLARISGESENSMWDFSSSIWNTWIR